MAVAPDKNKQHLANELLLQIFALHELPPAAIIGRERYEVINVPRGPLVQSHIKSYADNDLYTGACTHQHAEWKLRLRTLSAISKCSHRFRELSLPLLYRIYPGQTMAHPQLFLRTLRAPQLSGSSVTSLVKELVIDAWDGVNSPKTIGQRLQKLGLRYALVDFLESAAEQWNDEAHAALLLFYCSNVETLDLTCPAVFSSDGAMHMLFEHLRRLGPNTLARNNDEAIKTRLPLADLPLRKVRTLHLHHADHAYIRQINGLAPLIQLPTVQSVTAYRFWRSDPSALKSFHRIQELTLWRCSFESRHLLEALKACTELRSLSIIFAGCTSSLGRLVPEKDHPDFQTLGKIIRVKHKKLRKLRLDDREADSPPLRILGSLTDGPALEDVALNEVCLGCFDAETPVGSDPTLKLAAKMARAPLVDLLPSSVRRLVIFRSNTWWHESERGPRAKEYSRDGLVFRFDAMHDKVLELLQDVRYRLPELEFIHIDTPLEFGRDVEHFGWTCQRVTQDAALERPSIVADSLMKPEEKREWEMTQEMRAAKPSLLLRRFAS